jgi:hypothetical protein
MTVDTLQWVKKWFAALCGQQKFKAEKEELLAVHTRGRLSKL